jgi:hypothetical protein
MTAPLCQGNLGKAALRLLRECFMPWLHAAPIAHRAIEQINEVSEAS